MPTAVIGVIDVSGSMSLSAAPDKPGSNEVNPFTRLDLVKHSMKTVASMLKERNAHLGVITFSDSAKVEMPVRRMNDGGIAEAKRVIDGIHEGGGTNIWAGLQLAIGQAKTYAASRPNSNIHVILLTDGEPTRDYLPPQGIQRSLQRALKKLEGTRITISSFGFGYSLDSKLLEEISVEGGGTYGYIPDCSMVGTVFINYCASALSTVANNVAVGNPPIFVGNIQCGMPRTVYMEGLTVGDNVDIRYCVSAEYSAPVAQATPEEVADAKLRLRLKDAVLRCSTSKAFSGIDPSVLHALVRELTQNAQEPMRPILEAALKDLEHPDENHGQLTKAVASKEWFESWGLNHLIMYGRAMECEQCVNFKDAVLQLFVGTLFLDIQDIGNDVFNTLPVPRPTRSSPYASPTHSPAPRQPVSMAQFNYSDGGCFAGNCLVNMADQRSKRVDQIQAGDVVEGGFRVACVVRTAVGRRVKMIHLQGLCITPWHPVQPATTREWTFPADIAAQGTAKMMGCRLEWVTLDYYYNFVLETGHYVTIGGYRACTLGHGFDENEVIRHAYYGTSRVIEDLKNTGQWAKGLVDLTMPDGKAGLVTEMCHATRRAPLAHQPSSEAPLSLVLACV
jgi:uncharacterized protein YegL